MSKQNIKPSQYVGLNVGGRLFQTTIATLSKYDSMLRTMVTGDLKSITDEEGRIFIDRSGKHFQTILDYLQDGSVDLPEDCTQIEELLAEARYYLIEGLIDTCKNSLDKNKQLIKCNVIVIASIEQECKIIESTSKPIVKLRLNSNNTKGYHIDQMLEHAKLFFKLAQRFGDRGVFILDSISTNTMCSWEFYGDGELCGQVQCTEVKTNSTNNNESIDIKFPEGNITEEALATFLKCVQ